MQVMDIVNRAVMKSGVVSSFNTDEVPEDIQQRGSDVLRNEIIPELNCDRSVDVTEIVMRFSPRNGNVDLVTTPDDYPNVILETVNYTAAELNSVVYGREGAGPLESPYMKTLIDLLIDMGLVVFSEPSSDAKYFSLERTEKWPMDSLTQPKDIAFWTEDAKLFEVSSYLPSLKYNDNPDFVNHKYNVPFYPAAVGEVYRASDGAPLTYLTHGELVSAEFRHSQLVYTVEDNITKMRIKMNPGCAYPILAVLPVPVKVINNFERPDPWFGNVIAPQKFYPFLINILAWRMAAEYGVASEASMQKQASTSYTNILKNKIKREHRQDVPREIFRYLRGRGALNPVEVATSGGTYGGV